MYGDLTFVVAVNDRRVLQTNLLASPCLGNSNHHEVILQEGFSSAAEAYNDALLRARNELVVFIHQDVFLPESWERDLYRSLQYLSRIDTEWGVLGCWGVNEHGQGFGHLYTTGEGVIGDASLCPAPVQTLDELLLVIRRSSLLAFSKELPDFHFYGTDICMSAASRGLKSYAVSAFCIHNCRYHFKYPEEFYAGYKFVKKAWVQFLPIHTSCIEVTALDGDYYRRKLKQLFHTVVLRRESRGERAVSPEILLRRLKLAAR